MSAFVKMGLNRPRMRQIDGLHFWKLCGSGTGEGFTPVPNTGVYAILGVWSDESVAKQQIRSSSGYQSFANNASESWTILLNTVSARGSWSGVEPFVPVALPDNGPIVALTRATIRPSAAFKFWQRVPNISSVIGDNTNVAFKIGIGEVPLLHQVTFSIWPDAHAMADFARMDGPHARAIRAVRDGNWFKEELYARFNVVADMGSWNGRSPLEGMELAA